MLNNEELRETLTKWKELLAERKQRIAELEYNWQEEAKFSRAIIDARDKRIAELEAMYDGACEAGQDKSKRIAQLEIDLEKEIWMAADCHRTYELNLADRDQRIAQLEEFVRWVRDEGSDYWEKEAKALLEKGK